MFLAHFKVDSIDLSFYQMLQNNINRFSMKELPFKPIHALSITSHSTFDRNKEFFSQSSQVREIPFSKESLLQSKMVVM